MSKVEPVSRDGDPPRAASFGAFTIDLRGQVLHKHGIRLKVPPQTLRVLIFLVERAPNLVAREDLVTLLWPNDTHVDFTGNLNALIRDLRALLGDSARNPRYIQTELRRGYRFIAPVGLLTPLPDQLPVDTSKPTASVRPLPTNGAVSLKSAWIRVLALAVCVAFLLIGARQWLVSRASAVRMMPRIAQLTSLAGRAGHATLSPDGKRVAFHWDGNESGNFDIYMGEVGSEKFAKLTNNPADSLYPAWSPDGRDIAFLRHYPDGRCSIFLVPAGGGAERLIRDVPTESSLSWSSDGGWLAYTVLYKAAPMASSSTFGVYAISLSTGQVIRLTTPPKSAVGDEDGTFSPDGHRIAFFRSSSMGVSDLFVQELDAGKHPQGAPQQITFEGQNARNPAWTPDGSKIVFSSLKGGVRSLWQVPFRRHSEPIQLGGENAQQPVFDPSGNRIVYERITVSDTLQALPLCGTQPCNHEPPRRLAYSREVARNPSWSPDGKQIAFESSERGHVEVWHCDSDGSNAAVLTSFDANMSGTPRWAPDGQSLVMDSSVAGHSKIFLVSARDGQTRQLTKGDWEDVTPSFSHDGRTIYFASNRSGEFQVWKLDVLTGETIQLTRHGGFYAAESPDRDKVYYARGIHGTQIAEVPITGGAEKTVISSLSYWPNFAVGVSGIFFVPAKNVNGVPIWFHRFSDNKELSVATVPGVDFEGMTLAPDQRELLFSARTSAETNLMALSFYRADP